MVLQDTMEHPSCPWLAFHPTPTYEFNFSAWAILQPREGSREWDGVLEPGMMDRKTGAEEGEVRDV